jgi:hypothetical protein
MVKLILFFYAVVGIVACCFLVEAWVENPDTRLPYREPIHRRW